LAAEYELLPQIGDPDLRCHVYFGSIDMYASAGRLDDARDSVERLEQEGQGLTIHHRVHGLGNRVSLGCLTGRWDDIRSRTADVQAAVEANRATPCPLNIASLLGCALAAAVLGDEVESKRLEDAAYATGMKGYRFATDTARIWLALARGDLDQVRAIIGGLDAELLEPWAYDIRSALFDALVPLGDRERIEADAPEWIERGGYPRPFALRALGLVREDEALIEQAAQGFDALGLAWHAQRTRERRVIG
jgi:hypothetical protein